MENIFQNHARDEFTNLFSIFIGNIAKMFPECSNTSELKIMFENVYKNDAKKITETLNTWMENIMNPLNKKVKYHKAMERILKTEGCVYHACCYNDIDSLEISSVSNVMKDTDIFNKYRSMNENDRKMFWKYIQNLNEHCFVALDKTPPTVPTRDDIQNNIKSKKTNETEQPSMVNAFQVSFNKLCLKMNCTELLKDEPDDKIQKYMSQWNNFTKKICNEKRISTLCEEKDNAVFEELVKEFPEINNSNFEITEEIWTNITQLNGYSAVGNNIPTKMMGRIEDMANRLAEDIVNGKADLSQMDLSDIGQQVLSGCDESEMSQFANNIEELLPALKGFHKTVGT